MRLFRIYQGVQSLTSQLIGEVYAESVNDAVENARDAARKNLLSEFERKTANWTAKVVETTIPKIVALETQDSGLSQK